MILFYARATFKINFPIILLYITDANISKFESRSKTIRKGQLEKEMQPCRVKLVKKFHMKW